MLVKLRDIYNTKYFYISYKKDLVRLFSQFAELQKNPTLHPFAGSAEMEKVFDAARAHAELQLDIADCRFTSDTTPLLLAAQRDYGIVLVDSADKQRDKILKENVERLNKYGANDSVIREQLTELPKLTKTTDPIEWLKSLQKGVLYGVPAGLNDEIWIQLIVLTNIYRPSIQLYLYNRESQVLRWVANHLTPADLEQYDDFYMVTKQGVTEVNRRQDIYVQELGSVSFDEALTVASFVPKVFGTEVTKNVAAFQMIARTCIRDINKYINSKKVTIEELFGTGVSEVC